MKLPVLVLYLTPLPPKQEDVLESCRLQCLAQRLLTTFREAVTVGLEGTMLSAAPSGTFLKGYRWDGAGLGPACLL